MGPFRSRLNWPEESRELVEAIVVKLSSVHVRLEKSIHHQGWFSSNIRHKHI